MKVIYSLIAAMMLLTSCSDFLKEEDKDKVIPRTIDQFEAMLHQEGFVDVSWFYRSDIMTDDVSENTNVITTAKNPLKRLYTWQYDVERTGDGVYTDDNNNMWGKLYNDVLVANYVLERSGDIVDSEKMPSRVNNLMAEALFLRARAYFELVNIYAEPYDAATASTTQGIPLREGTGIVNDYSRSSVADVYKQIEDDLGRSIELFGQSSEKKSLWHPNKKAAQLLLSRVYLYKGEWQKVVNITTEIIESSQLGLYPMNRYPNEAVVRTANPEVFHTTGVIAGTLVDNASEGVPSDIPMIYRVSGSLSTAAYGVSDELLNMYSENDMRLILYFKNANGKSVPAKWHPQFTAMGGYTYRLAEAFLSRAEANAALNHCQEALKDMHDLLAKRIDGSFESMLPSVNDQMAVRRFVLDQRRMELCFENHRWYDLRRTQSWYPRDLRHVFTPSTSSSGYIGTPGAPENYTLRSTSPNYTFELPLAETNINSTIDRYGKREAINAE